MKHSRLDQFPEARKRQQEHRRCRARELRGRGGGLSDWLDGNQRAHDTLASLFPRVNASIDRVVLIEESEPREDGYEALDRRGELAPLRIPRTAAELAGPQLTSSLTFTPER